MSQAERKKIETEMGLGKIGKQYPTTPTLPPSAWRRTLKGWVLFALGCVLGSLFSIAVIILWKVWP